MNERFIRVNGQDFSFDEVVKALGVSPIKGNIPHQIQLCQRVEAGILVANGSFYDGDAYPGIDVELQLPQEMKTNPITLTRTEQPKEEGENKNLRTFCYSRQDQYFMFFDADIRPDHEVDDHTLSPSVTISGDRGFPVEVTAENDFVNYKGYTPVHPKISLLDQIADAESRSSAPAISGISKEKQEKSPAQR